MNIIAKIPVKGYLKQYALYIERPNDDIVDLARSRHIGYVLGNLFTGMFPNIPLNDHDPDYDDHLEVLINTRRFKHSHIHITEKGIRFFNSFLYRSFHDWLQHRIVFGKTLGCNEKDVIYAMMHELNIEDLVTFDAVKKAAQRVRKNQKKPIIQSRMCI